MKQSNAHALVLTLALLALALSSTAQLRYSPGQITTADGTTISGFLGEVPYTELRTKVLFKKDRSQKQATAYAPSQLQTFSYADGDTFESLEVPCAGTEFYADGDLAFFHVLAKGKIDLYELNGRKATPLFIKKGEDLLYLLCFSKSEDLDFRSILHDALEGTIEKEDLDNLQLKRKYVQKLVDNFNQGTPLANIGDQAIPYPRLSLGAFVGPMAVYTERNNYQGLTQGASLEIGGFAKKRLSFTASFQTFDKEIISYYSSGDNRYRRRYHLDAAIWSLRANYYPIKRGIASPYFFAGYQQMNAVEDYEKEYGNSGEARKVIREQEALKTTAFVYGGGLRFFFNRHSAFVELAKPQDGLAVQIGYRFSIWK